MPWRSLISARFLGPSKLPRKAAGDRIVDAPDQIAGPDGESAKPGAMDRQGDIVAVIDVVGAYATGGQGIRGPVEPRRPPGEHALAGRVIPMPVVIVGAHAAGGTQREEELALRRVGLDALRAEVAAAGAGVELDEAIACVVVPVMVLRQTGIERPHELIVGSEARGVRTVLRTPRFEAGGAQFKLAIAHQIVAVCLTARGPALDPLVGQQEPPGPADGIVRIGRGRTP